MNPKSCLAFALVALVLASCAWALAPNLVFDGTVVSITKDKLVLSAGTEQTQLELTSATKITLDGKPASVTELMTGHVVKVMAVREDAKLRALDVAAMSPK
jgi:hypothetical protein